MTAPFIEFAFTWRQGKLQRVRCTSPEVTHFLDLVRASHPYNTWVNYAHDLKVFFTTVQQPLEEITRQECVQFILQQEAHHLASSTINRRLAAVSSLFEELALLDATRFGRNPVAPRGSTTRYLYRRPATTIPTIVPPQPLARLFGSLPTWRDRTLFLLMLVSCLRISEAVQLQFDQIECSHRRLTLSPSKNGEARVVYMDVPTFTALNWYLDRERQRIATESSTVFVAMKGRARGTPLSINAVQKLFAYYAHKAGVTDFHAHRLRHTGITSLGEARMQEAALRTFVGHRRPESTQRYLHLSDSFVEREFHQAEAVFDVQPWLTMPLPTKE